MRRNEIHSFERSPARRCYPAEPAQKSRALACRRRYILKADGRRRPLRHLGGMKGHS
jgi:hypothetical protein